MTWLSGTAIDIKQKFEAYRESGFAGIDQLQFHLKVKQTEPVILYEIEPEYLAYAQKILSEANVAFQVRPFDFDKASLLKLRSAGIRWYVTDAPEAFYEAWQ